MNLTYNRYEFRDVETSVNRVSVLDRVRDYLNKPKRVLLYDLVTIEVKAVVEPQGEES